MLIFNYLQQAMEGNPQNSNKLEKNINQQQNLKKSLEDIINKNAIAIKKKKIKLYESLQILQNYYNEINTKPEFIQIASNKLKFYDSNTFSENTIKDIIQLFSQKNIKDICCYAQEKFFTNVISKNIVDFLKEFKKINLEIIANKNEEFTDNLKNLCEKINQKIIEFNSLLLFEFYQFLNNYILTTIFNEQKTKSICYLYLILKNMQPSANININNIDKINIQFSNQNILFFPQNSIPRFNVLQIQQEKIIEDFKFLNKYFLKAFYKLFKTDIQNANNMINFSFGYNNSFVVSIINIEKFLKNINLELHEQFESFIDMFFYFIKRPQNKNEKISDDKKVTKTFKKEKFSDDKVKEISKKKKFSDDSDFSDDSYYVNFIKFYKSDDVDNNDFGNYNFEKNDFDNSDDSDDSDDFDDSDDSDDSDDDYNSNKNKPDFSIPYNQQEIILDELSSDLAIKDNNKDNSFFSHEDIYFVFLINEVRSRLNKDQNKAEIEKYFLSSLQNLQAKFITEQQNFKNEQSSFNAKIPELQKNLTNLITELKSVNLELKSIKINFEKEILDLKKANLDLEKANLELKKITEKEINDEKILEGNIKNLEGNIKNLEGKRQNLKNEIDKIKVVYITDQKRLELVKSKFSNAEYQLNSIEDEKTKQLIVINISLTYLNRLEQKANFILFLKLLINILKKFQYFSIEAQESNFILEFQTDYMEFLKVFQLSDEQFETQKKQEFPNLFDVKLENGNFILPIFDELKKANISKKYLGFFEKISLFWAILNYNGNNPELNKYKNYFYVQSETYDNDFSEMGKKYFGCYFIALFFVNFIKSDQELENNYLYSTFKNLKFYPILCKEDYNFMIFSLLEFALNSPKDKKYFENITKSTYELFNFCNGVCLENNPEFNKDYLGFEKRNLILYPKDWNTITKNDAFINIIYLIIQRKKVSVQ